MLSLRLLQPRFGVDEMTDHQRSEFMLKWARRSTMTWTDLVAHRRHGLGYERIPIRMIRPQIPEELTDDDVLVFRHDDNLPFAGFRIGDVFYVLWIEAHYGDLYKH